MSEKPPAGWYLDSSGANRWWDGEQWTDYTQPPPTHQAPPTEGPQESVPAAAAAAGPVAQAETSPVRTRADAKAEKAYRKASRPWYKKKRWIGLIALVVLIAIIAATSSTDTGGPEVVGGSAGGDKSSSGSNDAGSKENPLSLGQTVKLEGTQYTVTKARTSPRVGSQFFEETANGIYVIVTITIENKKNETKTFFEDAAKFISSNGKRYSTDDDGSIAADDPLILEDMQPDVPKTGKLVFDVPKGNVQGGVLELSDLYGNGEAYIDLGL